MPAVWRRGGGNPCGRQNVYGRVAHSKTGLIDLVDERSGANNFIMTVLLMKRQNTYFKPKGYDVATRASGPEPLK